LPESIRRKEHIVHTDINQAIAGDQILIECRKPSKKWDTVRASEQHNYFSAVAAKNAYAVVTRRYTNIKE
jgi:hypothetical protein